MADKKAFIFDTNFIIQNKDLDEALNKLKEKFTVYVTQVSIDERIAQQCREVQKNFDEAKLCESKFIHFATIEFKKTVEEACDFYQKGVQTKYEEYFRDKIIPLQKDGEILSTVIDRANKRIPPFSAAKDASDKGFKDCLLWISILEYFKNNGEEEVVFVTDDGGFKNNVEYLCEEFNKTTGKIVVIKPNSYYNELLELEKGDQTVKSSEDLPDFSKTRQEIEEVIDALRWNVSEDYFGNENWYNTFVLQKEVDSCYMEIVFSGLKSIISNHIFECSIPAFRVLDLDGRLADDKGIPMKNVEAALRLYENILKKHPNYIEQFYNAAAVIINRSYKAPINAFDDIDDDLPF